MKLCKYCGHKNEDTAPVCLDCGRSEFEPQVVSSWPSLTHASPPLKPWPTSLPPRPWVTLGLAAFVVESPFLVTFLLVQLLKQCPHCRHQWLSWPILPGAFPS